MKIFLTGSGGMLGRNILSHPKSEKYDWLIPTRSDLDLLKARELINVVDIQEYFHNEDNIYQFFLDPDHLNEKGEEIINDFLTTN